MSCPQTNGKGNIQGSDSAKQLDILESLLLIGIIGHKFQNISLFGKRIKLIKESSCCHLLTATFIVVLFFEIDGTKCALSSAPFKISMEAGRVERDRGQEQQQFLSAGGHLPAILALNESDLSDPEINGLLM